MYRPKKHVRLTALPAAPDLGNVKDVFEEARKARGCTVELPWKNKRTDVGYSLTVRVELAGGDPVWTLYEGEGDGSRVVWSSSFEDVELLYDVLMLSIPEEVSTDLNEDESKAKHSDFETGKSRTSASESDSASQKLPEKPPGYYDSGLLKEEDLEIFQKQEAVKQSSTAEKKKEKSSSKSKKKGKKEKSKSQSAPQPQIPAQNPVNQSGAYPAQDYSRQSGAYPQPYPPPDPARPSGAYPQAYPPQDPSRQSGAYPQYPPPGYPQYPPPGYPQYPPPGYPQYPPQGYPNQQPGYAPESNSHARGAVSADQKLEAESSKKASEVKNKPNVRLGKFLVESGIVPQATVDAALQLQDLVRSGSLPTIKAAEAVRRAHVRGGQVDPALTAIKPSEDGANVSAPPLGQILVEAAILRGPILKSALSLQKKVRDSELDKEEAIDRLCVEVFGVGSKRSSKLSESKESIKAVEILKSSGLISEFDLDTASKVKDKHGGRLLNILESAGKLDSLTVEASLKCVGLMKDEKINLDKAAIALHYCQRSRVSLEDALGELGWRKSVLGIEEEEVEVIEIIEYVEEEEETSS